MDSVPPEESAVEHELRALYEEYELDDEQVAMISDPENEYAWIQSNLTMPIEA